MALSVWACPGLGGKEELLLLSFNSILELTALPFHRKHHMTCRVQETHICFDLHRTPHYHMPLVEICPNLK